MDGEQILPMHCVVDHFPVNGMGAMSGSANRSYRLGDCIGYTVHKKEIPAASERRFVLADVVAWNTERCEARAYDAEARGNGSVLAFFDDPGSERTASKYGPDPRDEECLIADPVASGIVNI